MSQRAAKRLDLPFVGRLLTLSQFQRFQHFFHIVQGLFQSLDDAVHILDSLLDGRWGCWLVRGGQRLRLAHRGALTRTIPEMPGAIPMLALFLILALRMLPAKLLLLLLL